MTPCNSEYTHGECTMLNEASMAEHGKKQKQQKQVSWNLTGHLYFFGRDLLPRQHIPLHNTFREFIHPKT